MRKYGSFCFGFLISFFWWFFPTKVWATTHCTATISPLTVAAGSSTTLNFSVTNTGSEEVNYVEIYSPGSDFVLVNYGISGWSVETSPTWAGIYGNTIAVSDTFNFSLGLNAGMNEISNQIWSVATYTNTGYDECTGGPFAMSISGSVDTQAPVQSEPSVTSLNSTSATVTWTTDEASTSDLYYGLEFEGENTQVYDGSLVTSHSLDLTGLSAGTTYYFKYRSVDESGNASSFKDFYSFSTPAYAETVTVTETVTQTVTVQATPPPVETKTIIIQDVTAPSVAISTDINGVFERAPTIKGVAQDAKGVFRIDYSTDGGRNWLPVDEMSSPESQRVSFSFTPLGLIDGNYVVKVRAIDTSNNSGFSEEQTMIIDRLPPRVGSTLLSIGPQPLRPTQSGVVYGLVGVGQKIVLSSVGGATSIDLLAESSEMLRSYVGGEVRVLGQISQNYSLNKNTETSLWYGSVSFAYPGLYKLVAEAVDGAENETKRELQSVYVLPNGKVSDSEGVVASAELTVMVKNKDTNRFVVWDGQTFLQQNPQLTNPEGKYGFILPPGEYYIEVRKRGFRLVRTPIFKVDDHTPINTDFSLEPLSEIKLFGLKYYVPSFKKTITPVSLINLSDLSMGDESDLVGEELPNIVLGGSGETLYGSDLIGKPTILSFLTTWSPQTAPQMDELDKASESVRVVGVFEQETSSAVELFMNRGGYKSKVWADEDGELVDSFSIHTTPTHVLIDSKGVVKDVVVGFLSADELVNRLY